MIVPMKKVHLVVLDSDRERALKSLRKLGTMHVVAKPALGPSLDALNEKLHRSENAAAYLRDFKVDPKVKGTMESAAAIDKIVALAEERKNLEESIGRNRREIDRLGEWGSFDPSSIKELAAAGIDLVPYELSDKAYAALGESVSVIVLSRGKKIVRCVLIRKGGVLPEGLPPDAAPLALPEAPIDELAKASKAAEERVAAISGELKALSREKNSISSYIARLQAEIEFDSTRLGMECLLKEDEGKALVLLEGFVPAVDVPNLLAAAKQHGWALIADDPSPDDAVPTKVKNHPIVSMIQPVFDFLGTVPNYKEYEISAWFLLFFCFFFAMIFGDAVYGLALFLIGTAVAIVSKSKGKPVPPFIRLLLTLSVFTMLWGVFTLTYLGLKPEVLPPILKKLAIWPISNENPASGDNIKVFCFVLGTVQLSFAHLKNIKRDIGSLKWLSQLGQFMMMVGMLSVVLNFVIGAARFPIPIYSVYLLGIGFLLSFVFANYEGSILRSILASFANFVSVFLGIVNVFADIVSYIRLWAVGLAGLAISDTLNTLLGPMLGKFSLFFVGIVVLTFGHGFNMVLSCLSVVVHGVRLNMLEFSGHLGMEWSGFAYRPFSERNENNETSKEQV